MVGAVGLRITGMRERLRPALRKRAAPCGTALRLISRNEIEA